MKLSTLYYLTEARTSDDVEHERGKNKGPEDLSVFLKSIERAKDVEEAKTIAKRMTKFFAKGGQEKFIQNVDKQNSHAGVLKLAYNAALKGEGLGVKK